MSDERQQLETGIAALEAQRATLGDAVVDALLSAMHARLDALRDAPSEPSAQALKQTSILFLDLVGAIPLAQTLAPEDVHAVMDDALARATAIVDAHRGRVLQYAGDSVLAVFGAGESREDDAERAVHCGLALLALGRALGAEVEAAHGHAAIAVRVGVHTGRVLLGGGIDADDSIRGLAVNIAARMQQTAPPGGLRISQDTWTQVRGMFETTPEPPLAIKGVDAPVASHLVQRARPRAVRTQARGIDGVTTRMVARDAELATLHAAFERLVRPDAAFERLTVVADAGLGKSRLVDEFLRWADARPESFFLFRAHATPQTEGQPYGLLRDLVAWRFGIGDGDGMDVARRKYEAGVGPVLDGGDADAEAHVHLLGQLIGLDYDDSPHVRGVRDDAGRLRARAFEGAVEILRRFGRRAATSLPLVLILDDLHWADDGSLDFVDALATTARDVPLLLLVATRPTLFERRPSMATSTGTRIDLRPLDGESSRRLADALLRQLPGIPATLRDLVTGGADGNPFYMEELIRMLIDQGTIGTTGERWTIDEDRLLALRVPPNLTGILQARLDGLPPAERRGLQLASVIGLDFWDAALAHVDAEAADQLPALSGRDLVRAKDHAPTVAEDVRDYAFRHQVLHQVTYDTLLRAAKRDAHARTARWLAEEGGARTKALLGTAAEHFERAGDAGQAAEYYARAAAFTASTFANASALDYAGRGLRLAAPDAWTLRWRLVAVRERILDLLGRRAEQAEDLATLGTIAETLDDDARRAETAWRRCDLAARTSDWPLTEREARQAIALARRVGDHEIELRAIPRLAVALAYRGEVDEARTLAEAALDRARDGGHATGTRSRLVNALTICANLQDDRVAVLRYSGMALALNRRSGDRRVETVGLCNLGNACAALGDFAEARPLLEEALQLSRALGNRLLEGNALGLLAEIAWRQGDGALSLARAEEALAIMVEIGARHHLGEALVSVGDAALALAQHDRAAAAFAESETVAREIGQAGGVLEALDGQMRVALDRDDPATADVVGARLVAAAGLDAPGAMDDPSRVDALSHRVRLTLHRWWSATGDARATPMRVHARRGLDVEAARITDPAMRARFVDGIAEHREIAALGDPDR